MTTEGCIGYKNSLSTDALWDPKAEPATTCNRSKYKQQRPSSVYHHPTTTAHSYIHHYVHPSQVQPIQSSIETTRAYAQPQYAAKPKSWDNLAAKGGGGYAFGYVVNNPPLKKHQASPSENQQARAPPLPRKSSHAPYGRYSTFADVENYVPAPQQYEETITKTTIITTKSTENLISNAQYPATDGSCECIDQQAIKQSKAMVASNCIACNATSNTNGVYQGYYSNLARNASNRCIIPTKTEITRL